MNTNTSLLPTGVAPTGSPSQSAGAWYCLRAEYRREHIAAVNLHRRTGHSIFAPRIRLQKPARGRAVAQYVREALFPGYIFAHFRYPHDARHVASTPGVIGLVSFGGPPPPVQDEVIGYLQSEVTKADEDHSTPTFEEGAWVRIAEGCFRGSEGRVVQAGGSSMRICVLMKLLGQEVQISVPADHLAGAETSPAHFPAALRQEPSLTSPARQ